MCRLLLPASRHKCRHYNPLFFRLCRGEMERGVEYSSSEWWPLSSPSTSRFRPLPSCSELSTPSWLLLCNSLLCPSSLYSFSLRSSTGPPIICDMSHISSSNKTPSCRLFVCLWFRTGPGCQAARNPSDGKNLRAGRSFSPPHVCLSPLHRSIPTVPRRKCLTRALIVLKESFHA